MFHVYIGYDAREAEAWDVASYSLLRHSSIPLTVHKLSQQDLRDQGLYTRTYKVLSNGQKIDDVDDKPFSTDFTYTRFLVPHLAAQEQIRDPVLFIDCDWLFTGDIANLVREIDDNKCVQVVKHNYLPTSTKKMYGVSQTTYRRKLWSAMIVFVPWLTSDLLTPEIVNSSPGSFLHQFNWVPDNRIGDLPEHWHWIPNVSPTTKDGVGPVQGIHFTEGLPTQKHRQVTVWDDIWFNELVLARSNRIQNAKAI